MIQWVPRFVSSVRMEHFTFFLSCRWWPARTWCTFANIALEIPPKCCGLCSIYYIRNTMTWCEHSCLVLSLTTYFEENIQWESVLNYKRWNFRCLWLRIHLVSSMRVDHFILILSCHRRLTRFLSTFTKIALEIPSKSNGLYSIYYRYIKNTCKWLDILFSPVVLYGL